MKIFGKSMGKPGFGVAVFFTLLISGCSQHQAPAPTASPAATGTPVASNLPAAPPQAASPAPPFQPYTLIAQPAPKPKVVTHRHRALKLTLRDTHPYLVDADGHYYDVGRDKQGHVCPIYRDPTTKAIYPLYYDSQRDRLYRVARADDGRYYRGYVGDSDDRYYASNTDYETYVPADRPEIIDSYNTYNTYNEGAPYYGSDPASAPAVHHHHNNDQWLWAIPVIVGAYLLLQPHHHHDHHYYAPSPQTVIIRQQHPARDFHHAPPFVARQPNDPGHGYPPAGHGFPGHPAAFQPNQSQQHGPQHPPTAFAGHTGHTLLPVGTHRAATGRPNFPGHPALSSHRPVTRQMNKPVRRLPTAAHLPVHSTVKHFVRPAPLHLRTVHAPGRTVVHAEHRLPSAVHRPMAPAHHAPMFVRPKFRRPITHRELTPPPTRRPQIPAHSFARPEHHASQMPRPAEHHTSPVRHDFHTPSRPNPPRPIIQHSAPHPTPPRPQIRIQPHAPPHAEHRPAPPRPQNRPSPPQNHPPQGGQHHGNDHPEHKDDHHH